MKNNIIETQLNGDKIVTKENFKKIRTYESGRPLGIDDKPLFGLLEIEKTNFKLIMFHKDEINLIYKMSDESSFKSPRLTLIDQNKSFNKLKYYSYGFECPDINNLNTKEQREEVYNILLNQFQERLKEWLK